MDQMVQRSNYAGVKFLIQHLKKDRVALLNPTGLLATYGVSAPIFDKAVKTYYDTPDFFFRKNGINISIAVYNNRSNADLVVRYDSPISRLNFISGIPDTFIKKINKREGIEPHYNYIAAAVLDLVPKGLSVDVFEVIRTVKPIMQVAKKRERYRIIHNSGLKMVFSFEQNTYKSFITNNKYKMPILEIRMESVESFKEQFNEFVRQVLLKQPSFLKQKHSDLFIGEMYTSN